MNHGLYIGIPSHSGTFDYRMDGALLSARTRFNPCFVRVNVVSLLCFNFNQMWAHALNLRAKGVTHFLLLHDDVVPVDGPRGENWATMLMDELEANKLDVLSLVMPIKNESGKCSTCLEHPQAVPRFRGGDDPALVDLDVFAGGVTWLSNSCAERLLINTGCLLVDFRRPWVEEFAFQNHDRILRHGDTFDAATDPEDWTMSRWLHDAVEAATGGKRHEPDEPIDVPTALPVG